MKVKNLFRKVSYPIELFDSKGNKIYIEDSTGFWIKSEYDSAGNRIYYEDSTGFWKMKEYDSNGNLVYVKNSKGK